MLTKQQVMEFLAANQVNLTDAAAEALTAVVNTYGGCLSQYDPTTAALIGKYAALLMALSQQREVTSERSPVGAARTYASGADGRRWYGIAALLRSLDVHGCVPIPENPHQTVNAGMWIGCSGCES